MDYGFKEKMLSVVFGIVGLVALSILLFGGCQSTPVVIDTGAAARSEAAIVGLTAVIDGASNRLNAIRIQAAGIADRIDRALYYLDHYDAEFARQQQELIDLRNSLKSHE
jgi:hypothetical protein